MSSAKWLQFYLGVNVLIAIKCFFNKGGFIIISGSVHIHGKYYKATRIIAPPPLVWLPLIRHNKSRFIGFMCRIYYIWDWTLRLPNMWNHITKPYVCRKTRPRGADLAVGGLISLTEMATHIWVDIGLGNGLLFDGTMTLPEPILTHHQWGVLWHSPEFDLTSSAHKINP